MTFHLTTTLAALALAPTLALAQNTNQRTAPAKPAPVTAATPAQQAPAEATLQARADGLTTGMVQGLGLTPAQTEKVRVINSNSVRNVEAARQRYRQQPAKLKGAIEDIGLSRLEQLKDVLTPMQFARYQQKREQKMGIPSMNNNQGTLPPGMNTGGRGDD